jgi:class 3 adenylate cyclase
VVAQPSGIVTFLFTDIEGSTRRWEEDSDAMAVALAAHDETLRAAVETHGGWLFVLASATLGSSLVCSRRR